MKKILVLSLFTALYSIPGFAAKYSLTDTLDKKLSEAHRTSACSDFLNYEHYIEKTFSLSGLNKLKYHSSTSAKKDRAHVAKHILPSLSEDDRLIVVMDGIHTYIHYKDHIINSKGNIGVNVRSLVKKSRHIIGTLAFVIHDLSAETKTQLEGMIKNPERKQALTCSAVTCKVLKDASSDVVKGTHWFTSALARSLMLSHAKGMSVEVISLNGKAPGDLLHEIEIAEGHLIPNPWFLVGPTVAYFLLAPLF